MAAARADDIDISSVVEHYEACFARHGSTPQGVDWPNGKDLATRFGVMLDIIAPGEGPQSVLDLGCGPGLLLDYLRAAGRPPAIEYTGLDISPMMTAAAQQRWPMHRFLTADPLDSELASRSYDYVLMNGVLTEKRTLSQAAMTAYGERLIAKAFDVARIGVAFNVMSAHLDYKRDDLFHWPFDEIASFLFARVSRHYVFRADYGLYEYMVYVFREPRSTGDASLAAEWWAR